MSIAESFGPRDTRWIYPVEDDTVQVQVGWTDWRLSTTAGISFQKHLF